MTTRELFEHVRKYQKNGLSLRMRLTLFVTVEMLGCIVVAYGVDLLIHWIFPGVDIPLLVELVLVCLLVGVLVTGLLSKSFFTPIKKLRKAMDKVADGDFSVRLEDKSSSKEIMEIYTGFNLMVEELAATEILQTDFVSNVSHEFKTPISAIEGYSMLLQGGERSGEEQRQYVDKILFNTNRLSSLVGSILLLSKLEHQQIPTHQTTYRLDEQIRQSVVMLEDAWSRKNIELDVDLDDWEHTGNEAMLLHVWTNIIGNAVKFSPVGGVVTVRLRTGVQTVLVTVEDQGAGLTDEAKKHLFDKFYQGDSSHKQEGNGLGLALVKRILDIEGGTVVAENCPDGGCRFTVELKRKTP